MEEKEIKEQIEKLRKELDNTKLQLEEKDKALEEKEQEAVEVLEKLEALQAKVDAKEEAVEETMAEKQTLEEKNEELAQKLIKLSDDFKDYKQKALQEKKQPIIAKINEYEQDEDLIEVYQGWSVEKLEERLDKVKKRFSDPQVLVTPIEEETKALREKLETKDVGMKALRHLDADDRGLADEIFKQMKANGEV